MTKNYEQMLHNHDLETRPLLNDAFAMHQILEGLRSELGCRSDMQMACIKTEMTIHRRKRIIELMIRWLDREEFDVTDMNELPF